MKLLGIIPARGGSKGIPNKNLQPINHKPLVMYTVEAAVESGIFDRIIVSSDSHLIIETVKQNKKIDVPFRRPDHLAKDKTPINDVIAHLLNWLIEQEDYSPSAFMLLEPTCPLRSSADIVHAYTLFKGSNHPSLISLSPVQQHPSDMIYQSQNEWHYCLSRKKITKGRQDFQSSLFINGAIYITEYAYFLKKKIIYDLNDCEFYLMPPERSFDIDTPFDLALVRAYVQFLSAGIAKKI